MAEAPKLKDFFTVEVVREIGERFRRPGGDPGFDVDAFVERTLSPPDEPPFDELEFTARSRRIADAIEATANREPLALLDLIVDTLPAELTETEGVLNEGFALWPAGDVIARHGAAHPSEALAACYELTKRFTAEFAIRPILAEHPDRLATLADWARDPNEHVRRLVSEGSRPRLPWAQRLDLPIDDILPILASLRADPSPYVRKSVANHLNDLAKTCPAEIIDTLADWHDEGHEHTRWIVRHALRNHLKDGTPTALAIFGYRPPALDVAALTAAPSSVEIDEHVDATFTITSTADTPQLLMIDIVMGYVKANGTQSPKVFKFRELKLGAGDTTELSKRFDMIPRSTRRLYPGTHSITVRINGEDLASTEFELFA